MTKFLRYKDLKERRTFNSRMTLHRAIKSGAFPPGRMLSPNVRAWTEEETIAYENSRPIKRERKADTNAAGETDDDDSRDTEASARDSAPSTGEAA
jgi:predicted DNA-binding transcriptional regulator AlpA